MRLGMFNSRIVFTLSHLFAFTVFFSGMAHARERLATAAEIMQFAVGRTVSGAMYYGRDGNYTYQGGSPGRYTISDGRICVRFNNGRFRCDSIVTDGKGYTLINAAGQRFPFR